MGKEAPPGPNGSGARVKGLSLYERLTFCWMGQVVSSARRGELSLSSLFLPQENLSQNSYENFQKNWEDELALQKSGDTKPSLLRAMRKTYFKDYFIAGIFKACWSIFVITGAFYFVRRCVYIEHGLLLLDIKPLVLQSLPLQCVSCLLL